MSNRNQSKADYMRLHIETRSKSGLTVSDYCTQNGIVKSCYYYWLKKLSEEKASAGFTSVNVTRSSLVEIIYPNGVQLSYTGDINAAVLQSLVCCI
jgi:hypothetical protein